MHSVIGIEAFDQSRVHGKVPQQPKLPTTLHALVDSSLLGLPVLGHGNAESTFPRSFPATTSNT
jgi:hypothetical protein